MVTASRDRGGEFGFWPSADEQRELACSLALPWSAGTQDWELEAADSERIEEFLEAYGQLKLSRRQRFSLGELVVASLDELASVSPSLESRVLKLLASDPVLHGYTMDSWSADDTTDLNEAFAVSGLMRRLRAQVRGREETQRGT